MMAVLKKNSKKLAINPARREPGEASKFHEASNLIRCQAQPNKRKRLVTIAKPLKPE
jgi:hypothetical protein